MSGKKKALIFLFLAILSVFFFRITHFLKEEILEIYFSRESKIVRDRNGIEIFVLPNEKGYFAKYLDRIPPKFKKLLIKKEDKFFYYHFGFNPISTFQAIFGKLGIGERKGSSTITQQLVKILLGKEFERNLKNKIMELFYAFSLEIHLSKEEILRMYANSIYLGNQAQGIAEASYLYFGLPPDLLDEGQILQLLTTISNPKERNPAKPENKKMASILAKRFKMEKEKLIFENFEKVRENMKKYSHFDESFFEIKDFLNFKKLPQNTQLTIDSYFTQRIRKILKTNIDFLDSKNVHHGAIIVIKLPENEVLTLVGSPHPKSLREGDQINMLRKERAVGSTIKPFIYLKAFEKGLRPYTLVEDREYKYITALGFPLYPKNFDFKYRGKISLYYALSNSLNVPAVKVLEFVGLENFYSFLQKDLSFKPLQNLENYQLGISLGALEMNLFDLARYFTIFPNEGVLRELKILKNDIHGFEKQISKPKYVQLINKILSDRKTGIEQFGLVSDLNLFQKNYALKTGTSRDFRDSWVIGYTPDFLVGVWLGNADNSPMEEVSGQVGAGKIWSEVMQLLFNSEYNRNTPFNFNLIEEFYSTEGKIEFGLRGDDYLKLKNLLVEKDHSLILNPHHGDVFLLEPQTQIFLKAKEKVKWVINGSLIGEGKTKIFVPQKGGIYEIEALSFQEKKEKIEIFVNQI